MKRPNHGMDRATSANRVGMGVALICRELRIFRADFSGTIRRNSGEFMFLLVKRSEGTRFRIRQGFLRQLANISADSQLRCSIIPEYIQETTSEVFCSTFSCNLSQLPMSLSFDTDDSVLIRAQEGDCIWLYGQQSFGSQLREFVPSGNVMFACQE